MFAELIVVVHNSPKVLTLLNAPVDSTREPLSGKYKRDAKATGTPFGITKVISSKVFTRQPGGHGLLVPPSAFEVHKLLLSDVSQLLVDVINILWPGSAVVANVAVVELLGLEPPLEDPPLE